jgi:EPS-associated MarR family transcriptional regulator
MLSDEYRYKILKALESNPSISQRELARELGISLGKINYCIQALIKIGVVKAKNFKNNENKRGYIYVLTPEGIEDKAAVTARFLRHKLEEHKELQREIEMLRSEIISGKAGEAN